MSAQTLIQVRRGTASLWESINPTLSSGEWGYETDTGLYKIGDGLTVWNSLSYASIIPEGLVPGTGIHIEYMPLGSGAIISVSGLSSNLITDFNSAVTSLISSASIDTETVQDIIGNSGIVSGFGTSVSYNDSTGLTTVSATGLTLKVMPGSGINVVPSTDNNNSIYTIHLDNPTIEVSEITDFSTGVSGLLPSISNGNNTEVLFANNNYVINLTGVALSGHNHTWSQISDVSSVVTTGELSFLGGVSAGTAMSNKAVVVDANKDISGIRNIITDGNITVGGNLTIQGTTTTVNSTTVDIGDNIIKVNASGYIGDQHLAGLEVNDLGLNQVVAQVVYDRMTSTWKLLGGNIYTSGNFIGNSLQVTSTELVTNLNSDLLDGEHGSYYRNFANISGIPSPIITGTLTGDISGTSTVTLNNLGNGTLSINAQIVAGSIVNADISNSAAIDVVKLAHSGVTLGGTTINLGQTSTVLDGLTRISGVSMNSPTYIYNAVIDGGTP